MEKPEEQPRDAVEQVVAVTGLDEGFVLPLPAWVDEEVGDLGVEEGERWRARDLLVAVMALVGADGRSVRAWLGAVPEGGGISPADATGEGGLDALDARLVAAYPTASADAGLGGR